MRTRTAALALVVLIASIAAIFDLAIATDSAAERPTTPTPILAPWPLDVTGAAPEATAAAVETAEAAAAWYAGVAAEEARMAAIREAATRRSTTPSDPPYHPGTTEGDCTGFAIPDWIIQRESGGNPSAYNQSGAYGCAQTLLSHYQDGRTCAELDPFTIEGQRECVWRLSAGGTNLQPWAMG